MVMTSVPIPISSLAHSALTGVTSAQHHTQEVIQKLTALFNALDTGTTVIPNDDTKPQITEGDQYMTLAFTPTNASNRLQIESGFYGASSVGNAITVALFQDADADALAAVAVEQPNGGDQSFITLFHEMVAGGVVEIVFRIRAGGRGAGTTTFNGNSGARKYDGVAGSYLTVSELAP